MKVKIRGGQKMDEGVKISKSNILPIMLKNGRFSSLKGHSENLKYLPLTFYQQLKLPHIQILDALLNKTRKTHASKLETFSSGFLAE